MNLIPLYHGSTNIIYQPIHGLGKPYNDYGLGFYTSESIEMAKEWACSSSETFGYVNEYRLDLDGLKILDLKNYHILNWLAILLENRYFDLSSEIAQEAREYILKHFKLDYENYDVIIGYRADDSYFSFASAFLNNTITLSQLSKAMVLGELGEQICLKSKKAFDQLYFKNVHLAENQIYYQKRKDRDTNARKQFQSERKKVSKEIYIIDILREEWTNDEPRLYINE